MTNDTVIRPIAGRYPLRIAVGALPLVVALACAGAALADPDADGGGQPGATTPSPSDSGGQPGATPSSPMYHAAPAPAPVPAYSSPPRIRYVPPPAARPAPAARLPAGPLQVRPAPLPPDVIRIGYLTTPAPDWIPVDACNRINATAAEAGAQIGGAMRAVGLPPDRADRIADTTTTGAAAGFAAGAMPGVLIGGAVGAVSGALVGAVVGLPALIVGAVPGLLVGAAAGAVAGAALGGAVTGATLGIAPGAVIGAAAGLVAP